MPLHIPYTRHPDVAVLAFELGLKPVLRLEGIRAGDLGRVTATWERRGFAALPAGARYGVQGHSPNWQQGGEFTYLFVSHSPEDAARAAELDVLEKASGAVVSGEERTQATVELGRLLGYPECCSRRFAALPDRGNNNLWPRWCLEATQGPPHWLLNNIRYLSCLVTHLPCSYHCEASIAIASRLLEFLDQDELEFARAVRTYYPVTVLFWDYQRYLAVPGKWDGKVLRPSAVWPPGDFRPELRHAPESRILEEQWYPACAAADTIKADGESVTALKEGCELLRWEPGGDVPLVLDFTGEAP